MFVTIGVRPAGEVHWDGYEAQIFVVFDESNRLTAKSIVDFREARGLPPRWTDRFVEWCYGWLD
jgi:hypothetical protein